MFKDTLSKFLKIDTLISNLTGYVETKLELLKIEVKEELAKSLAKAVSYLIVAFILALFVVFISVGVALQLGQKWGNSSGFSIVAAAYLIAGLILWFFRQKLISRIEKQFESIFRKKK